MILLYGATGFTGTLVARELLARGLPFTVAGRDAGRLDRLATELGGVETRLAPVHDAAAMAAALDGAKVVINCAGPFARIGEPVVAAAIAAGVHYLDTSGEQAFVKDVYERYESAARRAGVAVVNACAYEVALGDWAAALAADRLGDADPLDELAVAYAIEHPRTSRGTQLSIIESLSAQGFLWDGDRWDPAWPAAETRDFHFPEPFGMRQALSFPSPEVITIPRHIEARRVQTYLSLFRETPLSRAAGTLASLFGPAIPALFGTPLGALARARADGDATAENRGETRFAVLAEARFRHHRAYVAVSGADVYGVTADITVTAAAALASGELSIAGVLAPSQVLPPRRALSELAERRGLKVVEA